MRFIVLTLWIFSFSSQIYGQVNLNNGLVAWLNFSGNTLDVSGNGRHGFPQNGGNFTTDRSGQAGQAFLLDGIDDYIRIPDPGAFSTTPFSVSIWIKSDVTRIQAVLGKRDYGPFNQQQFQIVVDGPGPYSVTSAVIANTRPCEADLTADMVSRTTFSNQLCKERWHSVIVTYNGQRHRMYVDGVLVSDLATQFTQMITCNADLRIGNWWSGDPLAFQGAVDDFRWYNRPLTNDEIAVLAADANQPIFSNADFTSRPADACDAGLRRFDATGSGNTIFSWNFGDGQSAGGNASPVHRFAVPGQYLVQLITGTSAACQDTIAKLIDTRLNWGNLLGNADTALCVGGTVGLRPVAHTVLQCLQLNGQAAAASLPYSIQVMDEDERVLVTGRNLGPNLVVNGDFDNGNSGFSSDYALAATQSANRQYGIVTNPLTWSNSIICQDCGGFPPPAGGSFLVASAADERDIAVWRTTVNVTPNTSYQLQFSAIVYGAPPNGLITMRINGLPAGTWSDTAGNGRWATFTADWNAGAATALTLDIVNAAASTGGIRFGIDQVSVRTFQSIQDTFHIRGLQPAALQTTQDTAICPGASLPLTVSGATSYLWFPAEGLSDPALANPVASPLQTTTYRVRATNAAGCQSIDSVLVTVEPVPDINLISDTSVCAGSSITLLASGADTYSWSPLLGLSNNTISSPDAAPVQTTRYRVSFTESTGCTGEDSVLVTVNPIPVVNASDDTDVCAGEPTTLSATGGLSYVWFPASGLSDPNAPEPVAAPNNTTRYFVQGFNAQRCFAIDSVLVTVNETPVLTLLSDTVICQGTSVVLRASGASRYEWTPTMGLSDPSIASPVATPTTTTVYTLAGYGPTGCVASRSVRITVGADAQKIFVPNAFTPNGDGLNDCIGVNGSAAATRYEFAIFNRFGEKVFSSQKPGECWDGTFRGERQPSGTFVYYLIIDSPCGPAAMKGTLTLIR